MSDISRNLFFFFRGPTGEEDRARDRQLEDNLTKSLVTVLEHADRDVYLAAFARLLGLRPPGKEVSFSLQRRPVGAAMANQRVVVSITGGTPSVVQETTDAERGRPDAWILTDKWAVLIESKLGARVADDQLRRHAAAAGWGPRSFSVKRTTWKELHALFRTELTEHREPKHSVSRLLVTQWLDFLKGQQMVPFDRLESDDFDFFTLPASEQRPALAHMHGRIRAFQELLAKTKVARRIAGRYGSKREAEWKHSTAKAGERMAWFNIGGEESARTWHVTAYVRAIGVRVEVLGSSQSLTFGLAKGGSDRVRALVRLCARSSDTLDVGCRRGWYNDPKAHYKGQHISRTDEPLIARPGVLDARNLNPYADLLHSLLRTKDGRFRKELIIRHTIPRDDLVGKGAAEQVGFVEKALGVVEKPLELLLDLC